MTEPQDTRPAFYRDRDAAVQISTDAFLNATRLVASAFELVIEHPMTKDLKTHRAAKPLHALCNLLRAYSAAIHSHQPQQALQTFQAALRTIHDRTEEQRP